MKTKFEYSKFTPRWFLCALPGYACGIAMLLIILKTNEFGVPFLVAAALGLPLLAMAAKEAYGSGKRLKQFLRNNGTLEHPDWEGKTPAEVVAKLEQQGFAMTAYPMENYHGVKQLDSRRRCILFLHNHNTPDCPAAEEFSALYIEDMLQSVLQSKSDLILIDLSFGDISVEEGSEYQNTLKRGFSCTKDGRAVTFTAAYDTGKRILYCTDAIKQITWGKNNVTAGYAAQLMGALFGL